MYLFFQSLRRIYIVVLKLNSFIGQFFPANQLPINRKLCNLRLKYFNTDIESRQIQTEYNADIEYLFNSHGFRSKEFDDRGNFNVLSVGCSVTFGIGIPADKRYSRIFCDKIEKDTGKRVVDWNMAMPGESIDYIARIVLLSLSVLKPDVLITNFPSLARREFFDVQGRRVDYRPNRDFRNFAPSTSYGFLYFSKKKHNGDLCLGMC